MNAFGEKIQAIRRAKGYSLRQLAALVGVGFTYRSKVESGKLKFAESPSASLIHRLADALDADEDELMLLAKRVPESLASRTLDSTHRCATSRR